MLAAQTSTQLHAQFRVMGHHTSAEQDEFCRNQMQEIAIQAVETTDAQRQLYFQEAGEEPRRNEDGSGSLVNYLESRSQNQSLESSAIESERHRLPNQEPFLSRDAPRREYSRQQQVIEVQMTLTKHLDDASEPSQEEIRTPSEETVTLRREIDESGKFSKSMVDWTASEQFEEIRE